MGMAEQLEEEQEAKADLQRALSKSHNEVANWRSKYENDDLARMEELEESKARLAAEFEDLQVAFERQTVQLANADKKQRNFDKDFAAQASKYEEVNAELEAAQKSFRDLSADNFKLSQSYDESQDAYAALKKEWKNLKDENAELADQLATGGKSLYEVGKAKKKAEADYEEMKSALEESRVLRLQLELAAAKADVDKKLAEKDEEFEATKKNHARALESMQATLDVEVKARSDAHKAKKSLEAANADLEMQYDVLSKNFADAGKNYKKLQASFKDLQDENDAAGVAYS